MRSLTPLDLPRLEEPNLAQAQAFVGEHSCSYEELNENVSSVAAFLSQLRVQKGDRVCLWADKSPQGVTAILGTLRAGCAYVPIDGGQPFARARIIFADAEPVVLFTDAFHLKKLKAEELPRSLQVIVVVGNETVQEEEMEVAIRSWSDLIERKSPCVKPLLSLEDLAAILYTSGSTGIPKGVQISHRNLANFVGWATNEFDVGPDDVFANHASFNFDLSTFDLFVGLSVGASIWIIPDSQTRDVSALARGVREYGISVWYSVPSILHLLTSAGTLGSMTTKSLRYVLFAGEVFPNRQLKELVAQLPAETELYNLYGPTETNVCTYHRVCPEDLSVDRPIPIGKAAQGAQLFVLDESDEEIEEEGLVGELVVEGDCVTPGYFRGAAYAGAFPFEVRRHRTGDLVSWREGRLVYRGRKDRMVKLNGFRVELGEVEAAVLRHPALAEAVVLVNDAEKNIGLTVYYVLQKDAFKPSLISLKQHCAKHLPKYMVPRSAICLDSLPYNRNGKVDYQRLSETNMKRRITNTTSQLMSLS